jgi:hypothetical protein
MYVHMVQSRWYLPVVPLGAELWDSLVTEHGEPGALHLVALACRARLGVA